MIFNGLEVKKINMKYKIYLNKKTGTKYVKRLGAQIQNIKTQLN